MNEGFYFDAHCHIFNLRYVLKEVKNMLHDTISGSYPRDLSEDRVPKGQIKTEFIKGRLIELLIKYCEVLSASSSSEEGNLDFLRKKAKREMPEYEWIVVPLMMDIYYMYDVPLDKGQDVSDRKRKILKIPDDAEFQKDWDRILEDVKKHITSKKFDDTLKKGGVLDYFTLKRSRVLKNFLEVIEEERDVGATKRFVAGLESAKGFFEREGQTEGFYYHMNNLVELEKKRKGELYPFIAVDPRRPGIIDEIVGGNHIGKNGPFYGVKLYPRLGYHPECKPLKALYQYCNEQKIPITFHCGKGGFPPFDDWEYAGFGEPKNFEQIIKDHPNLKINFAHFGSSEPDGEWALEIVGLMEKYENVYSDFSCYVNEEKVVYAKKWWDEHPILQSRLMFGTDYDVIYFMGNTTLKKYFKRFKGKFEDDLKRLAHDNPTRFFEDIMARS